MHIIFKWVHIKKCQVDQNNSQELKMLLNEYCGPEINEHNLIQTKIKVRYVLTADKNVVILRIFRIISTDGHTTHES